MGSVPQSKGRPSQACGQCRARHGRCDRQIPCSQCCLRGLNCTAYRKSRPGACDKRPTPKPHAPQYLNTWFNFIVELEHGRHNIFDSIYNSKTQAPAQDAPQSLCQPGDKTSSTSSSATKTDFDVSSTGGIIIPVSEDDNALYDDFHDPSLYRLAEGLAQSRQ
ncbi:hypothetical protein BDV18DRAFT_155214 [Aspergillus unguis]